MQKHKVNYLLKLSNSFLFGALVGIISATFLIFTIIYMQEDALLNSIASSPKIGSHVCFEKSQFKLLSESI